MMTKQEREELDAGTLASASQDIHDLNRLLADTKSDLPTLGVMIDSLQSQCDQFPHHHKMMMAMCRDDLLALIIAARVGFKLTLAAHPGE